MAATTVTKALSGYFNVLGGESLQAATLNGLTYPAGRSTKRPAREWLDELKALGPEAKQELAEGVVAITGDTLS